MNSLKRNAKISIISFSLFQVFRDATVDCHSLGQFDRRWAAAWAEKGAITDLGWPIDGTKNTAHCLSNKPSTWRLTLFDGGRRRETIS